MKMKPAMQIALKILAAGLVFFILCYLGAGVLFFLIETDEINYYEIFIWLFACAVSFLCGVFVSMAVFVSKEDD